jgi:Tol biopolymer transport system component
LSWGKCDIYLKSVSGGEEKRLTNESTSIYTVAWGRHGREILYTSERGGVQEMWRLDLSSGKVRRDPVGKGKHLAVSPVEDKIIYGSECRYYADIYRVDCPDSGRYTGDAKKIVGSALNDWFMDISADGKKIIFSSGRTGNYEIWLCDIDGKNQVQLTNYKTSSTGLPHWSPDGRLIAYQACPSGHGDIYIMKANGDSTTLITDNPANDAHATWSRDGRSIYFCSNRSGSGQIWKYSLESGETVQVTENGGIIAFESLDGESLYYAIGVWSGIWKASITGDNPHLLIDTACWNTNWTVGRKGIYYIEEEPRGAFCIKLYSFATRKISKILDLGSTPLKALVISPDETFFLYADYKNIDEDLYLVENFR